MKFLKKHVFFITVLLMVLLVIFSKFITTDTAYVIGYDIKNIYVPFYEEIRTLFRNGELPFWSHNFFLGGNILASKGYYFLGDLFAYFSIILSSATIEDVLLVIQIMKFALCTILMYLTLKEMNIKKEVCWFSAFLFTLSSWMILFMGTPAFATFAALLPMLMLSLERYLNKGKFGLVAVAAFLLVMDNFYLFWSASFYLILYWPCRYYLRHQFTKDSILPFIKSTAFLLLIYCLGAFCGSFMLIPTVQYMIEVPRVTSEVNIPLFWQPLKIYMDMFIKWISAPFYVNTDIPNFFGTTYYRTDQIALYCSSLCAVILPQIYAVFERRHKIVLTIFYGINVIMLIFPIFGSLLHGLAEPSFRWTIMLSMAFSLTVAHILNRHEKTNVPLLIASILSYAAICGVVFFYVSSHGNLMDYPQQLTAIALAFCLMIIYAVLLTVSKKKAKIIYLLGILVLSELSVYAKFSLENYAKEFQDGYDYEKLGIDQDYFSSLEDQNNEFYRIYINEFHVDMNHQLEFNYNSNMYYNFKGLYGYDSTAQPSVADVLLWSEEYYWWFKINNRILHDILSVKYFVAKDQYELGDDYFKEIGPVGDSGLTLYENTNYKPFGFTYNDVLSESELYNYYSIYEKTVAFELGIVHKDEDIELYDLYNLTGSQSNHLENLVYSNNHISGDLKVDGRQLVFFSIPYDKGWTIRANGEEMPVIISEGGFMSILLPEGDYHITLDFYPTGLNTGILLSAISLLGIFLIIYLKDNLSKQKKDR